MKVTFFGVMWAAAQNIFFLGITAIVAGIIFYNITKLAHNVSLLIASGWQKIIFPGFSLRKQVIKKIALLLGMFCLSLALLRPQWGTKEQMIEQEGRELLVALDISRSMMASDIKPNRLAFAKSKIKKLVKLLHAERVGLIVFSGDAFVQCPLTRDTAAFNLFLDNVDAESLSSGTTSIAHAISKALQTFASLPTRKNKIVVVYTDGEDFSSGLTDIKEEAKKIGLHIFTYGVGTEEGAPVPVISDDGIIQGHQKDEQGKVVFSRLNSDILQALSRESGGKYIAPTQDESDMKTLVTYVESYEKERFDAKEIEQEEERYPWFVGIAFVCLLCEWLL